MFGFKNQRAMRLLLALLVEIICVLAERSVSYKNYRVYDVEEDRLNSPVLKEMSAFKDSQSSRPVILNIKSRGSGDDSYVVRTYLVPSDSEHDFVNILKKFRANYTVPVKDLGKLIDQERKSSEGTRRSSSAELSHIDAYLSYSQMEKYLEKLATKKHPKGNEPLAVLEKMGKTYEGRDMYLVKVSSNHTARKPVIFFEAGMHAREWLAPSTALHIVYELVENYTANADILEDVDFYVVPVSNPDGYEYSRTTDRLWRKTRSIYRTGYGTDGNRNFDFHWGEHGSSDDPQSEIFGGSRAFSEIETRNIRDAGIKYKDRLIMFLSIHAYGGLFVYPWSYARTAMAPYTPQMKKAATLAADAIERFSGTKYTVGNSAKLMYDSPGGSDDYFKGVLGVEISITMELSSDGERSFIVPARKIRKIVTESFVGIKAMAEESYRFHKCITMKPVRSHASC